MGQTNSKLSQYFRRRQRKRRSLSVISREVNSLVSMEGCENVTQLWLAACHSANQHAAVLIKYGADVNQACGSLMMSPLHMAVFNLNVELMIALLENGADPNQMDNWNYTPLIYAALQRDSLLVNELFSILLKYGADANFGAHINSEGHPKCAKNSDLIHLHNLNEDEYITYVSDPMGPTSGIALHHAVQNPYLSNDALEVMLNAGAQINFRNLHGQTPMMGIVRDIYFDYHRNVQSHAELLISQGADLEVRDWQGWTCFHYAAQRGNIACLEMLLKANANCDQVSNVGESPLWILLANGWRDALEYLLRSGCEMDRPASSHIILKMNQSAEICRYGDIRPLEFAICNRLYRIAELMCICGCRIDGNTWLGSQREALQPAHGKFLQTLNMHMKKRLELSSLMVLCRDVIRGSMKQGVVVKSAVLHLPPVLRDFITFNDAVLTQ